MSTVPVDVFFLLVSIAALIAIYVYKYVHKLLRKSEKDKDPEENIYHRQGPIITKNYYPPKEVSDEKSIIFMDHDDVKVQCNFSSDGSNGADSHAS
ncbi:hypothetical protein PENTCL1PPCAC_23691 [Pristionchus entomophagus]|uniref:Uncharacterized protein n=1 Tax=Pristionchus entomophagus TaxID=358040 RepID=A0AAV5U4T1_9BILA|nr:hypothetical protein PENTCL1PPCAC_23691 [Pristionchus entomophagus]